MNFHPCRQLLVFPVTALYTVGAWAEKPAEAEPALLSSARDPLSMNSLWQLTLGMVLVLGLILIIAWLLKRTGRFQAAAGGGLRILGGLSMGSRERVILMQVGATQLLVGVAPGRIQTLHVLEQPVDTAPQSGGGAGKAFADQLDKLLNREKSA